MKCLAEFLNFFPRPGKSNPSFTFHLPLTSTSLVRLLKSIQSDFKLMEVEKEIPPNTLSFSFEVLKNQQYVSITTHSPDELLSAFCRVSLITQEEKSLILASLYEASHPHERASLNTPLLSESIRN